MKIYWYSIHGAPRHHRLGRWKEDGIQYSGIYVGDKPIIVMERCGESLMMQWYRRYVLDKH